MNAPENPVSKERNYTPWIVAISILIPAIVAVLFYMPALKVQAGFNVKLLPPFHATLNFLTTLLLIGGFLLIRKGRVAAHKVCMVTALALSVIFLLSYVVYHSLTEPARYGGVGLIRPVYFFLLISHIVLAAVILPFVLVTLVKALNQRFDQHRRIARITLPLWLYVTVTGVVVYLMMAPYY